MGCADNRSYLSDLRINVGLDFRPVNVFFLSGNNKTFDILNKAGDLLGSLTCHTDRRRTKVQRVRYLLEAFNICGHGCRNRPNRGVIFRIGNFFAGRNLRLDRFEIAVDVAQGLQRNHRTIVSQNTGHFECTPFSSGERLCRCLGSISRRPDVGNSRNPSWFAVTEYTGPVYNQLTVMPS